MNIALNWPLGLDTLHAIELDVDKVNANGGLDIGGAKYVIELIVDDHKMDQALAKTNAQKELFEDKVDFILGDIWCSSYISLVESNDMILLANPSTDIFRDPELYHVYYSGIHNTNFTCMITYIAQKFPNLKTFIGAFPNDEQGCGFAADRTAVAEHSGLTILDTILYPPNSTDLSAVGTKVKGLNPDILCPNGGGPQADSQVLKATYDAGWNGLRLGSSTMPAQTLIGIAGAEAVEGMVALAWPAEFEPATHPLAAEFKADYIAEYGEWTDPEIVQATNWWVLKTALQQAGSIEPAAVRAVLDNGMKFDSIGGSGQMISRPDFGVTRTMEIILGDMPIKKITNNELVLFDTMTLEQAIELFNIGHGID